jgi:hypothetical protein
MPLATRMTAPSSGEQGFQVHDVELDADWIVDSFTLKTSATVDVTTLCPCSKAISDYGAHNQRSRVTLTVHGHGEVVAASVVDTFIFFSLAFQGTRVPWLPLAAGDLGVRLLIAFVLLIPFRVSPLVR